MSRLQGLVFACLLSLQGSLVFAGPVPDAEEKKAPVPPPGQRSEDIRRSLEKGLSAGFGFRAADLFLVDGGVEFAYFSQPNEVLSIRLSNLSGNETDTSFAYRGDTFFIPTDRILDMNGRAFSVNWKSFLSNTFYIKLGLEQFDLRGQYVESVDHVVTTRLHLGDLRRQNALFSVGNQWQWKAFTMGCDWGGLTHPLTHRYDSYHDEIDSSIANRFATLGDKTLVSLLYFYLGASL